jgi:hypothetical protein
MPINKPNARVYNIKASLNALKYDVSGSMQESKIVQKGIIDRENDEQRFYEASSAFLESLSTLNEVKDNNELIELGASSLETQLGAPLIYEGNTPLDWLAGRTDFSDINNQKFFIGGKEISEGALLAEGRRVRQSFATDNPVDVSGGTGWTFKQGQRKSIENAQKFGLYTALAQDPKHSYNIGEIIYNETKDEYFGGIGRWSTYSKAIKDMIQDARDGKIFISETLSDADYNQFLKATEILNDKEASKDARKTAKKQQAFLVDAISQNVNFSTVAPYLDKYESTTPYDINQNVDANDKPLPYSFDLGSLQNNLQWLLPQEAIGKASYDFAEDSQGNTIGEYSAFNKVKEYLDKNIQQYSDKLPPAYTPNFGKKEGFDFGDLVGDNSIFNKRKQNEPTNYMNVFEDPNIYQSLLDAKLINPDFTTTFRPPAMFKPFTENE